MLTRDLSPPSPHSHQPVLRGEERVHVGGAGGGHAAADGAEPAAHAADAHRHPEPQHVPTAGRLRHEHPVPPHRQAGGLRLQHAPYWSYYYIYNVK